MNFFIDVQGTLIDDTKRLPIPGSKEFIEALNQKQIPYVVITNNTKQPSRHFLEYLRGLGFGIKRYIDPLMVLQEVLTAKKVAAYGVEGFLRVLQDLGYELDYENPDAVVLSVKEDYDFATFAQIDEFLLRGAKLFGMHQTSLYAKGSKRYPGVGALLAMFEFACGVNSQVVGKPSPLFYERARQMIGVDFSDITIISDDAVGDLVGAKKLGMKTVLLLSGKIKKPEEVVPKLPQELRPDIICKDIYEAGKILGVL